MQDTQLSQISNFIWGVADDYLRDLYVRGKYRDVILPMTVLRHLDAVLEPTKEKVLEEKKWLDEAGISEQAGVLEQAAGQAFYNTSPFQLKDLTSRATQQQLRDDFNAYLDEFSPNVQDILEKFEFRNQIAKLSEGDVLGSIVSRFLNPQINLNPEPVLNQDGSVKLPGLDNHAMGTIFEDLVRRFNENNNEEAGEHWTPRDAVELIAQLVYHPIRDRIESGSYLLYDGAIGTGGMLTIAEQTLRDIAGENAKQVSTHLYGQEINNETYAICKADMLLKGEQNIDQNIILSKCATERTRMTTIPSTLLSKPTNLKEEFQGELDGKDSTPTPILPSSEELPASIDLRRLVKTLHRILRDYEGNSNLVERFDELTKIIYCKTFDEWDLEENSDEAAFRIRANDTDQSVASRIRNKFHGIVERRSSLFPQRFSHLMTGDSATRRLAEELAGTQLAGVSEDLKGLIYEEIIRNTFDKGENQQFFTPRPIVEFMVQMLDSSLAGTICDPACGTGGFLLYVNKYLKQHGDTSSATLLGFEIDERLAWVAGVNLDMQAPSCQFTVSHINSAGSLGNKLKHNLGTVDTIITNPPFGSDLSEKDALEEFELGKGRASRRRGVLFIERCLDLLKPGGIVGIIIDDGVLNSPSNIDTRRLILARSHPLAIISLPDTAFMPYASVKASILFLQKKYDSIGKTGDDDKPTFFAHADTVGRKPNGDPLVHHDPTTGSTVLNSSLPQILAAWRTNPKDLQERASMPLEQCFWTKVPGTEDESFGRAGYRIDPAYHHPTRNNVDKALRASCHPLKSVGEICELRNERFIPSKNLPEEEITYLGLASIESCTGVYTHALINGASLKSTVKRFVAGDILFAKMRPGLRKVCLIANDIEEGFTSAECLVLTPRKDPETGRPIMLPELLTMLLRSDLAHNQIIHLVTGIGRPRLSKTAVLNVLLPIPPLADQKHLLDLYHRSDSAARSLVVESERALRKASQIKSDAGRSLIDDILNPAKV